MLRPRFLRLLPALLLVGVLAAPAAAQRSSQSLPASARSPVARSVRAGDPRIEQYRQRTLQRAASGHALTPAKQRSEAKVLAQAGKLRASLRASKDDRPILVILEGADGAGKSSTIERLRHAFDGARELEVTHFGAPPADAEQVHWMKRFFDKLPHKGQVAVWDRSYYGRAVYDPYYGLADGKLTDATIDEINGFEQLLSGKVRVVKIYLDASGDRQAKTIGKREAIAPEKLAESDYVAFRDRKEIRGYFKDAIARTGKHVAWHKVDMDDRGDARLEIMKLLRRELAED